MELRIVPPEYRFEWNLAVIENLRLQRAAIINNCVQGVDWLKKELAFERFARETLAAELANCHKRLSGVSNNPQKSP
jgi:hypothetical protein